MSPLGYVGQRPTSTQKSTKMAGRQKSSRQPTRTREPSSHSSTRAAVTAHPLPAHRLCSCRYRRADPTASGSSSSRRSLFPSASETQRHTMTTGTGTKGCTPLAGRNNPQLPQSQASLNSCKDCKCIFVRECVHTVYWWFVLISRSSLDLKGDVSSITMKLCKIQSKHTQHSGRHADARGRCFTERTAEGSHCRSGAEGRALEGALPDPPLPGSTSVRCECGWVCFSYHLFHWPFNSVFAAQPGRPLWISQTGILHSPFCQPYFK